MANQYAHIMPAAVNHKANRSASANNMLFFVIPISNNSTLVCFVSVVFTVYWVFLIVTKVRLSCIICNTSFAVFFRKEPDFTCPPSVVVWFCKLAHNGSLSKDCLALLKILHKHFIKVHLRKPTFQCSC